MTSADLTDDQEQLARWNERASLGDLASTQDRYAKRLEMKVLGQWVKGPRVLDAGCGDGETLVELTERLGLDGAAGLDFSPAMLARARARAPHLGWHEGSLLEDHRHLGRFTTVYTERALINLKTWPQQAHAIHLLARLIEPGGRLILMENCLDGVRGLNEVRHVVGLPPVVPPPHNRYLEARDVFGLDLGSHFGPPHEDRYSDWYYFLSRIVNAYDADHRHETPRYDSPINFLAVGLQPMLGRAPFACGQGRLWMWERSE